MGSFSDYLEDALLDHIFSTGEGTDGTFTRPDKYIALCTVAVTDTANGDSITEPTSGSYGRIAMHTWDEASGGATQNKNDIAFAQATGDWGTIVDFAICDAASSGHVLAYGSLTISKSVASGDTPKFATGDLDITLA